MNFLPFSPIPLDHDTVEPVDGAQRRYLAAMLAVGIALLVRWLFQDLLGDTMAYTLFMPAVLVAAGYGGFGPGLLALVLSELAGNYFFQASYGQLGFATWAETARLGLSLLSGMLICILGAWFYSARWRATTEAVELVRQAERFRASDESYRRMFETAYEGIYCLDESDSVIYVNGRLVDMLGYSIIGMVGHSISDFLFAEDWPRLQNVLEARRKGGKEVFDLRLRHKNGSAMFCIVSTQPMFSRDGSYCGSLNMVTDITARRLSAEDVNQLLDRLKSHVRAVRELQESMLARLRPEGDKLAGVGESGLLEETRQAIARTREIADQMSELLRSGNTSPTEPAEQLSRVS